MKENLSLSVREMEAKDISLITDYWLKSPDDFLVSMGVDLKKIPKRADLVKMLNDQILLPMDKKTSYALIWELNKVPVGHSNVNQIKFGKQATMHLHLWNSQSRKKGMGNQLVKKSLPFYFDKLQLKNLFCEPYELNPAPNKTLKKIGFECVRNYVTIPGFLNFEQKVNRWELSKDKYKTLK